jgi:hypothetical protein
MRQATYKKFPLNDPEHRTCEFKNVCMVDGALIYFQKNQTGSLNVPVDYTPQGNTAIPVDINRFDYLLFFIVLRI